MRTRTKLLAGLAAGSILSGLSAAGTALGQSAPDPATDIGSVRATAPGVPVAPEVPQTADQYAPSRASLDQIEPSSTVGAETIRKVIVPTQTYNDIVRLTPSAMDVSPAGPGLQQDFGQSIRGLQYTQFSVLYDGIPIPGFPFNFAPQPGIYFTSRNIDRVVVNRGPGQASAIGAATFGGYVELFSPEPANTLSGAQYNTFGSFDTRLSGVEVNTGALNALNGGRGLFSYENLESAGATTYTQTHRNNGFAKFEQPIGDSTVVTALVNIDHSYTKTPYGATLANINLFGRNYALNNDPLSQTYSGYNHDDYNTDFEYIGVKSDLGDGWKIDNKVYTTSYYQNSYHGMDVGGQAPNLSGIVYLNGTTPTDVTGDVPGLYSNYYFRNTGDVLRVSKDTAFGQARVGLWAEHELFATHSLQTVSNLNFTPYTTAPGSIFTFQYRSNLDTYQPYAEFAWKALPNVTVTAGLKYSSVTRTLKGPAGLAGVPQDVSQTYGKPLPSFDVNWRINDWASAFAQAAVGFETPNLNLFSTTNLTKVNPSTTDSYQVGTVIDRPGFTIGTDLYYIKYDNFVSNSTVGGITTYFNQGGAVYKGIEVEGTAKLPRGFALYANGSLNSSSYDSNGNVLAQTPRRTAAIGLLYDQGNLFRDQDNLYATLITKFVGPQYSVDTAAVGQYNSYPIKSYSQVDFSAGYTLPVFNKKLLAKINVWNIFDDKSIVGYGGNTIGPPSEPLFFTNSGRSFFFSIEARI